jgi:REP element-mobilizing transposase RayT
MNTPNPAPKNNYNNIGPVGYLITIHSYGTWFHGDPRGSIDKEHNMPGTPMLAPDQQRVDYEMNRLKYAPVTFSKDQRTSISNTVLEVAIFNKWILLAVNARTEHVHIVITSTKSAEIVMNNLKSWCTRKMNESGLWNKDYSPWSRHGSTRYLWDEYSLHNAINYVLYRQG